MRRRRSPGDPSKAATGRRDLLVAIAVVLGVVALQYPFRLQWASLLDEGAVLQIADDLRRGRQMYLDAIHYALPGIFYVTAAAFSLFGTSIATARALAIILFALLCGVAYLIARWWYGRVGALALVVAFLVYRVWAFPHWQMLSYSTAAVLLAIAAAWVLGEGLGRQRLWPFAVAGFLGAAAMLCKQDVGATATGALGLAVLICRPSPGTTRWRRVAGFSAGAGAAGSAAALAIWMAGIGPELIRQTVLAPLYGVQNFAYVSRPALWPLLQQDADLRAHAFSYLPSILVDLHWADLHQSPVYRDTAIVDVILKLIYALPWLLLIVAVPVFGRGLRAQPADVRRQRELVVALLALGFFAAFNRPHDWIHLLVLYPPTLLLGAALASRLPRWLRVGMVVAILVPAALASSMIAGQFYRRHSAAVVTARGTLYTSPAQASSLQRVVDTVSAGSETTPVAALPYAPLVNFLTARPGLTRFYLVWPIELDRHRDDEIVARLEAHPDARIVYSPTQFPQFPRFPRYAAALFRYLADHYSVGQIVGGDTDAYGFLVLERTARPGGHSLLGAALATADVTSGIPGSAASHVTGAQRDTLAGEAVWPFAHVLRMATLPHTTVTVAYRLTPVPGERLETAYGLNPDRLGEPLLPSARVRLLVRDGSDDRVVLDRSLDRVSDGWQPVTLDLSPWANRAVELLFQVTGVPGTRGDFDLVGWAEPRVVGGARGGTPG